MKTIVVSAVNLRVGGTLTILRDCLEYLSRLAESERYRIVALVYDKELADYPNIEYIELQWPKKTWVNRLWCEYVTMKKISKELAPVYLWLSLHDTTPNVIAERRAVYCHNPFPFYRWKARELLFTPKIVLFALFSKYAYKINIGKNRYVIVQQQWIKDAFLKLFKLKRENVIVALPTKNGKQNRQSGLNGRSVSERFSESDPYVFFFAGMANSHKNFETLCAATQILTERVGRGLFEVYITIRGDENGYARWLIEKWGRLPALRFTGFLNREELYSLYEKADCLVFPSKVETWGLPITEFASFEKPMLLADLPYAHETASGCAKVSFFNPDSPMELSAKMEAMIQGHTTELIHAKTIQPESPLATSWTELFTYLLQ